MYSRGSKEDWMVSRHMRLVLSRDVDASVGTYDQVQRIPSILPDKIPCTMHTRDCSELPSKP